MSFRLNESIAQNEDWAVNHFIKGLSPDNMETSRKELVSLIRRYGPVVDGYPSWHPLVAHTPHLESPVTTPERVYDGVDHTVLLRHGFITCPYDSSDILKSVESVAPKVHEVVLIRAEELNFPLYNESANPVIVYCDWLKSLESNENIPASIAMPLMLEMELKSWVRAERAETWETMRPYILGRPCGARSSMFVDEKAGLALKKAYLHLMDSGAYGPYKSA